MPRPKENKIAFTIKMDKDKKALLEAHVIALGYFYIRDGITLPSIGKYLQDLV